MIKFFTFIGVEFGRLIEVSLVTIQKTNLTEVWLKVEIQESNEVPVEIISKFLDEMCMSKQTIFSSRGLTLKKLVMSFSSATTLFLCGTMSMWSAGLARLL